MKHNRRLILFTAIFMVSILNGLCWFVTPIGASTTTYAGSGNSRPILEQADRTWYGTVSQNYTLFQPTLPSSGWRGYRLGTAFANVNRTADYIANGQFTGSPNQPSGPWSYYESGDTSYLSGGFSSSPPQGGTTTGSDYLRLQGKTTEMGPAGYPQVLYNMNFSTSPASTNDWNVSKVDSGTPGYGTFTSQWVGNPDYVWEQKGTFTNPSQSRTVYADMYCDQNFTYGGSVPPLLAVISWKAWASTYSLSGAGQLRIRLILTYFPTPSSSEDHVILDWTPTSQGSKPTSNTFYDISSLVDSNGKYRVRLWTYATMTVGRNKVSTLAARWDDVGIYIRYDRFSTGSAAQWGEQFGFGQYAAADGQLSFRYHTNLTAIVPSTDSYISAWVDGISSNRYDIIAFSSITTGSWQTATLVIPAAVFNNSGQITIRIGVNIGSNLLILTGTNPRFYFDNVTFFIKYKPTPESIRLGIYDDANSQRWGAAGTYGAGALTITPSTAWSGGSATFHFVTNGTNGKVGYNSSIVAYSYASTMYVMNQTLTRTPTFTVHDDTNTAWYFNYTTPSSIGGYSNYNISVYVPADWIQGGVLDTLKYNTVVITDYSADSVNSSTWVVKIPASDLQPLGYLLETWTTSPNYLGPSGVRVLLYTQGNKTNTPSPNDWRNSTYFIPQNTTRLVGVIRDGNNGIPGGVSSFQATARLYNASKSLTTPYMTWTATPNSTGHILLQLHTWSATNTTWWDGSKRVATSWFFEIQWKNSFEAASGIVYFTTNNTVSVLVPTSLTAPKAPYVVPYGDSFTLVAVYSNINNGSGIEGATVQWRWIGQSNISQMVMTPGIRGNYTASISRDTAALHNETSTIQVNATLNGYVTKTVDVSITVRDVITTGSASSFVIPYQTYAWNTTVQTSLTYQDADHNLQGIAGATLYVNNTYATGEVIGSSGIRWWYNDLGSGNYAIFFNATSSTPTGTHPWVFTVKANKSHYQQISFNLNGFNIRDRLTTHTEPSLSITMPWGDNATFYIAYRDTDAAGAPILGAAASSTWTDDWSRPYTMTILSNGTYRFSLDVIGLAPGTYQFSFSLSKVHWAAITTINAQVVIRRMNTDLTSSGNTITVYWGNNQTALLVYKDLDHNLNISLASWDTILAYDKQSGTNYSSSLIYNIYVNPLYNSWTIRVNGSLPVGNYTLWLHAYVATVNGYYVDRWFYPTLNIKPVVTSLAQQSTTLTVVWSDSGKIIVNYTDNILGGKPILGASVAVFIDPSISWSAYENASGIYTVFLNTTGSTDRVFPYSFTLQLSKLNYAPSSVAGALQINPISTRLQVPAQEIAVAYGGQLTFTVFVQDLNHTLGVYATDPPLTVRCNWTILGWKNFDLDFNNGTYLFSLDSTLRGQGLFTIRVEAITTHYKTAISYYSFIIGVVNTSLTPHGTPAATPWGDQATIYIDYRTNATAPQPIGIATVTTNWTLPYNPHFTATGEWQIDFDTTGLTEGIYSIRIDVQKQHYQNHTMTMSITIRAINIELRMFQKPDKVPQGSVANITIQLWDLDHSQGVTGASLVVSGLDSSLYAIKELSNGYYELEVNTGSMSPPLTVSFTVDAVKPHFSLTAGPGEVSFDVISAGFSTMTVIMIGGGSSGAVVLAVLGYVFYRRSKIPFIIKKIDQSIKLISKAMQTEPVEGLRTRAETPLSLFLAELESLGIKLEKVETRAGEVAEEIDQEEIELEEDEAQPEKPKRKTGKAEAEAVEVEARETKAKAAEPETKEEAKAPELKQEEREVNEAVLKTEGLQFEPDDLELGTEGAEAEVKEPSEMTREREANTQESREEEARGQEKVEKQEAPEVREENHKEIDRASQRHKETSGDEYHDEGGN